MLSIHLFIVNLKNCLFILLKVLCLITMSLRRRSINWLKFGVTEKRVSNQISPIIKNSVT